MLHEHCQRCDWKRYMIDAEAYSDEDWPGPSAWSLAKELTIELLREEHAIGRSDAHEQKDWPAKSGGSELADWYHGACWAYFAGLLHHAAIELAGIDQAWHLRD